MDKKIQMMDAGTALFTISEDFGTALGMVKTAMGAFGGTVYRAIETGTDGFPEGAADADLLLDFSSRWRNRCISCKLEYAGEAEGGKHRYAAVFKQGDSSGRIRDYTLLTLCVIIVLGMITAPGAIRIIAGILLIILIGYWRISPSKDARIRVEEIIKSLASE